MPVRRGDSDADADADADADSDSGFGFGFGRGVADAQEGVGFVAPVHPTVSCPNELPAQVGAVEDSALTDFARHDRHDRHLATVRIDRIDRIGGRAPQYVVTVGAATLPPPGD